MKARSIARELALLGISQLTDSPQRLGASQAHRDQSIDGQSLSNQQLDALLVKALTTLSTDARETLETADGELQRGERLVLESETRTVETDKVRSRIQLAVPLVQSAINQAGNTLDLLIFAQQGDPKSMVAVGKSLEMAAEHLETGDRLLVDHEHRAADISDAREQVQQAIALVHPALGELKQSLSPLYFEKLIDRPDVRSYARDLLDGWIRYWQSIDTQLNEAMEHWNMRRLARVDRDILRLAMVEIAHQNVPTKVAIDEAVSMAKRYSDEAGYRFINGVLRRVTDKLKTDGTV